MMDKSKKPVIPNVMHRRQNPLESKMGILIRYSQEAYEMRRRRRGEEGIK
jgi:hypothetical protein